jgi:flagellar biosynthesis/type III secretory pathway chaperone
VNTLKYVKEKQEEFSQKFQTINKLYQLCKQDNIKVGLNLQQAIDEVSHLYE